MTQGRTFTVSNGEQFGDWTVIDSSIVIRSKAANVLVRCSCGKTAYRRTSLLVRGVTSHCGHRCIPPLNRTHGHSYREKRTSEYVAWSHMKQRCSNSNDPEYKNYGGRGITVCDRWFVSYDAFLSDVGRKPSPEYSIDRIDNNGNYEPGNIRWATISQQNSNLRPRSRVSGLCEIE